jgi:16S rRNA processing protein RimM
MSEYINIGYIAGFHGVKGEVKIKATTDFVDQRFAVGNILLLTNGKDFIKKEIISKREHKGFVLVTFKDVTNLNDVEIYKGYEVKVAMEDRLDLEEDEFYYFDLVGMNIVDYSGNIIGSVIRVMDNVANEILVCQIEEQEVLIPFVKAVVKEVDKDNNNIYLNDIDGLF